MVMKREKCITILIFNIRLSQFSGIVFFCVGYSEYPMLKNILLAIGILVANVPEVCQGVKAGGVSADV